MFRIEKYRITFDKHCHDFSVVNNIDGSLIQGSGRYDTCCHIIHGNMVSPTWNGKALLHPNDPVDKIIGKKIALRNAMIRGHRIDPISKKKIPDYHLEFNHKPTRTKIWKAFWAWTESWSPAEVQFEGRVDDNIIIPPLEKQRDECSQIIINLDTKNLPANLEDFVGAESIITIKRTSK